MKSALPQLMLPFAAATGCLLVLVGCSGGGLSKETFPEQRLKAACERYVRCGVAKTQDGCYQALAPVSLGQWPGTPSEAELQSGKVSFDADAAKRCIEATSQGECSSGEHLAFDCTRLYVGHQPVGASCKSQECVPDAWCTADYDMPCGGGTCKAEVGLGQAASGGIMCQYGAYLSRDGVCSTPGKGGSPCDTTVGVFTCADGFSCDEATQRCVAPREGGAACSDTQPCDGYFNCIASKCLAPGDVGDTCAAAGNHYRTWPCKLELVCGTKTQTCIAPPTEGQPCAGSLCGAGLRCDGVSFLCARPLGVGDGCDPKFDKTAWEACGAGLFCGSVTMACRKQVSLGEPCVTTDRCVAGYCANGKCVGTYGPVCP